jgi:hypothetical protein
MSDEIDLPVKAAIVICAHASECKKAAGCFHGRSHANEESCRRSCGTVCYDIVPPRRAWCELKVWDKEADHETSSTR